MDLTCFAVVRAMDVIVGELWARRKAYLTSVNRWGRLDEFVSYIADTALFSASSVLVMVSEITIHAPLELCCE